MYALNLYQLQSFLKIGSLAVNSVIYDVYYGCALADSGKTRGREIFAGQTLFKKEFFWKRIGFLLTFT